MTWCARGTTSRDDAGWQWRDLPSKDAKISWGLTGSGSGRLLLESWEGVGLIDLWTLFINFKLLVPSTCTAVRGKDGGFRRRKTCFRVPNRPSRHLVVQTHFTRSKYPSKRKKKCVYRIDVFEHKADFTKGINYWQRHAVCENMIPYLLRKIQALNERQILLEEEEWLSTASGCLRQASRLS